MKWVQKTARFFLLDTKTKLLYLEAFFFLGVARFWISIPFSKVAPLLGSHMQETTYMPNPANLGVLRRIGMAIEVMSHHTFWDSKCLVRAMAAMKMLERRKVESTLYLGTGKDESGNMVAHAWLRSGPFYITGAGGMESFTVVGKFAKTIH